MKMKGKTKISTIYVRTNLSFFIGVASSLFLLMTNTDTPMSLAATILVMGGLLFSVIPDLIINLHIGNVSVFKVRIDLITKLVITILLYNDLEENYMLFMLSAIGIMILINLCMVYSVWHRLRYIESNIGEMAEAIKKSEGRNSEQLMKYLVINAFNIALFLNMQDSEIIRIIFAILCIAIHFRISEKLLLIMKNNSGIGRMKYRMILWIIQGAAMFMCVWKKEMFCYVLEGVYWWTVIDISMRNETAILNERKNKRMKMTGKNSNT